LLFQKFTEKFRFSFRLLLYTVLGKSIEKTPKFFSTCTFVLEIQTNFLFDTKKALTQQNTLC